MSQSSRDMLDQGIDHHLDINSGTITCLFHGCGVTLDNMDAARRHIEEHGSLVKDLFRKCVNCHKQYNKIDSLLAHMIFQCDEKSSHQINCSCTEYWLEINN
ncbi:uncharacterized protein SPAPADRAFT_61156 [Spathaspora passalidarum NRRL Y-27907]|uniref:C2H2-type domain-containing protein n=1 Tax=Spathaspora passalidarum (strain NRRL Y-27907 / 11-Y1) TaxID=619300 RepID=G3AP40_SPAPN|nr:uncharacterized protein SPAPADRAFT_61156 [Spathaspora passalidarum NRRL Y-27907]EGW32071.1 hypothetical protein SPAPADRAFT_61156 [Spathaspora passalidarum NRRL Y-27907]